MIGGTSCDPALLTPFSTRRSMATSRRGITMNNLRFALAASALLLAATTAAWPFGTVRGVGQNAEHERITRHALGCGLTGIGAVDNCFEDKSLQELAGTDHDFGAVGIPDRGDLITQN